jgi:hypothetical protein
MSTEENAKKDVVPAAYREKYKATGGTNGDFIGTTLQKLAKEGGGSMDSVKAENGIEVSRWATFNPGMQRMNLANVLRGRFLKGETITILGKQHNAKHRVEDYTGKVEDDNKSLAKLATFLELQDNDRTIASLRALFFPKDKGPSAEERAAARAEKAAAKAKEKADAKAARDAAAAEVKAAKDAEKAKVKEDKAKAAADAKAAKAAAKTPEPAAA